MKLFWPWWHTWYMLFRTRFYKSVKLSMTQSYAPVLTQSNLVSMIASYHWTLHFAHSAVYRTDFRLSPFSRTDQFWFVTFKTPLSFDRLSFFASSKKLARTHCLIQQL